MRKTTTFLAILVIALPAADMAWAGPAENREREVARVATKEATAAYNLGHYDEAASRYEEAYRHVPDPMKPSYTASPISVLFRIRRRMSEIGFVEGCNGLRLGRGQKRTDLSFERRKRCVPRHPYKMSSCWGA